MTTRALVPDIPVWISSGRASGNVRDCTNTPIAAPQAVEPRNISAQKRVFDLSLACCLAAPVALSVTLIGIWLLLRQGRPVFFRSERMATATRSFQVIKFRTMAPAPDDGFATGGDKDRRITAAGLWLRKTRLDELPQLWNILAGDMSFVGPRPPLRRYVEQFPELYAQVLQSRPGLTGLATLLFHKRERILLARTRNAEETDEIYRTRCVPAKARLDIRYSRLANVRYDLAILIKTLLRIG